MTRNTHLEAVLDELAALLERPIWTGSPEERRVHQLLDAVASSRRDEDAELLAQRLDDLGERLAAFERRRERARHAHDLAPGRDSLAPMVGGDLRPG